MFKINCLIFTGSESRDLTVLEKTSTVYNHLERLGVRIERDREDRVLLESDLVVLEIKDFDDLKEQLKVLNCTLEFFPETYARLIPLD